MAYSRYKEFNQEVFNRTDRLARELIKNYLRRNLIHEISLDFYTMTLPDWMGGEEYYLKPNVIKKIETKYPDYGTLDAIRLYMINDNPDKYGQDLFIRLPKKNSKIWIEVEMKSRWEGNFNFSSVHIPYRKKKFLNNGECYFFIISGDLMNAMVVDGKTMTEDTVREISNTAIANGELFFDVRTRNCVKINLCDNAGVAQ
jgi:hypothetical protein